MTGRLYVHRLPYKFSWQPAHRGCTTRGHRVVISSKRNNLDYYLFANVGQMDRPCLEAFVRRQHLKPGRNDYYLIVRFHVTPSTTLMNGQPMVIPAGRYYVVNPADVSAPDPRRGISVLRFGFSQPFLRECRELVGIPKSAGAFDFKASPRFPTPSLRSMFDQVASILRQPSQTDRDPWLPLQLLGAGREIIRELWFTHPNQLRERLMRQGFSAAVDPRLQHAMDYFKDHLAEPSALPAVGRAAGLSHRNLFRLFSQQLGCTPHDFLRRRRVEEAEGLLKGIHPPALQVVAERVGFKTAWGLRRAWKLVRGDSPTSAA